ncbi:N-acetylneuraminate synthase family protein [bacterium]|nr:N-acetylneuraminate synthase family protein [bacterium]MBU0900080.1 N-acetylneuraminate synthase family protein [bacterium]MBU1152744.1 N-acetylneuraminate synthase family protein [bacterium]MBU1782553.1 N-acetylneuraminate synthase family protein [bacterium]MBU2599088.1 N-acetylneuraminate synthase family protein [bacterium]
MKYKIKIEERMIGDEELIFIIAEAGINHNGEIEMAKKLIIAAAKAGADAVKFQTFSADKLVSRKLRPKAYDLFKSLSLKRADYKELFHIANEERIMFLSTPFDEESARFLAELGVKAMKIASGDITNLPFLSYVGLLCLPVILSTGASNITEVSEAVETLICCRVGQFWNNLVLLHCVSSYPAPLSELNLNVIENMKRIFNVPIGFSDHTTNDYVPLLALAKGACLIEKHFTLDKNMKGPDQKLSLDPQEMAQMIKKIREAEKCFGSPYNKETQLSEMAIRTEARKSVVVTQDIKSGTIITKEMLSLKRPGIGLSPKFIDNVVGKAAQRDIQEGEIITTGMILKMFKESFKE